MKKLGIILAILVIVALAGCASGGGGGGAKPAAAPDLPPIPEGAERVSLMNGAYVIYRFDLPAGAKWSDYSKITAEYMLDEENLKRPQRNGDHARLMGNYKEENFKSDIRLNINNFNGPWILDNTPRKVAAMNGVVANQWFTIEYDISGTKGHEQFNKANLPAANATGPFFFGIGIPGPEGSMRRDAITQLIQKVTLVHRSNPALNAVSLGSGFEGAAMVSYYPQDVKREGPSQ